MKKIIIGSTVVATAFLAPSIAHASTVVGVGVSANAKVVGAVNSAKNILYKTVVPNQFLINTQFTDKATGDTIQISTSSTSSGTYTDTNTGAGGDVSVGDIAITDGSVGFTWNTKQTRAASYTPVYRLYNKNTGEHFYTESAGERDVDVKAGWNYEGIGWSSPLQGAPIYRVYNPNAKGGDHYYTASQGEASQLVKLGWKWDNGGKAVFYSGGNTPVYVAYNPNAQSGAHNYTKNTAEQGSLINKGWKYSAIAWYAVK